MHFPNHVYFLALESVGILLSMVRVFSDVIKVTELEEGS